MEMGVTDLFVEIFIAGVFYALAISPLLYTYMPAEGSRFEKRPPLFGIVDRIPSSDGKLWILVGIALLYCLGIGGNRLVQTIYELTPLDPIKDKDPLIKQLEFAVSQSGDSAAAFVERHKTYRKVLRAASFSSLVFFFSMGFHNLMARRDFRYLPKHYISTAVFFVLTSAAFYVESAKYLEELHWYHDVIDTGSEGGSPFRRVGHQTKAGQYIDASISCNRALVLQRVRLRSVTLASEMRQMPPSNLVRAISRSASSRSNT